METDATWGSVSTERFTVAIDTTPLVGPRTGIGEFTARLVETMMASPDAPTVLPYVLSRRAGDVPTGTRRLLVPAAFALRVWARFDWPRERHALEGTDVVHGTNYIAPPTGWPTLLTVHDSSPFTRAADCEPAVRAFATVVRRLVHSGAWVHTPSVAVADQVRELLNTDRVRAVHHGPPPRFIARDHPLRPSRPYVLSVGTLEPRKNLVRLVEAYGAAQRVVRDLALVLAGPDGIGVASVERAIAALDRSALVVRTGWVSADQRTDLLQNARLLAYPSLDEGFGFPLLEAMDVGVPVVASTAGAIPEIAADAAVMVDPFDVDGLAAALLRVLADEPTRAELIARGHRNVTRFSWRKSMGELVALYRDTMTDHHRTSH